MINGYKLKKALIDGAAEIEKHYESVDAINVFPVPDGDTGTNLSLTLGGCASALKDFNSADAGKTADYAAGELLKSARGNSGVIFSLIFQGFAESIKDLDVVDGKALAKALESGCNQAYSAIEKPTEGTMLTVIRMAASKAVCAAEKGSDVKQTFEAALNGARSALQSTRNLLPILKKKGIVDAGAQGLVYILEGMAGISNEAADTVSEEKEDEGLPHTSDKIYCTEFLITRNNRTDISDIRRYLSEIGDCPAAAEHSGIIKIHVHTNSPHLALQKGLEYGELSRIKIDNMRLQSSTIGK
ncbi:MAG: DAK2 domain-containing protein [Clostridia bacterium]|nr:DAK2 domain-containing protein [Clostridia bacterium]